MFIPWVEVLIACFKSKHSYGQEQLLCWEKHLVHSGHCLNMHNTSIAEGSNDWEAQHDAKSTENYSMGILESKERGREDKDTFVG